LNVPFLGALPLDPDLRASSDAGKFTDGKTAEIFSAMAEKIKDDLQK
jgi:hypothetical protein